MGDNDPGEQLSPVTTRQAIILLPVTRQGRHGGKQFIGGVVDTGNKLSPVFSPVSLILVRNNQKAKNLSPYKAVNT
jgi:hypothetical protein